MKSKTLALFICMLSLSILITTRGISQQQKYAKETTTVPEQMANGPANGKYTYRLFVSPGKVFGYNILSNGKVIFHQPALPP